MVWDWMIATYLFLAGMGAGAFALAAIAAYVAPDAKRLRTVGYVVAPVAVGVGCLLLMVDARAGFANPLRFIYLVSNLSSVMAWGVIILSLFIMVTFVDLIFMLRKGSTPKVLDGAGLVLAVCTAAYTGLLLGMASGYPLWNPVVLPILFIVSATGSGFAIVLLLCFATGSDDPSKLKFLKKSGMVLPALEAVLVVVLFVVALASSGSAADAGAESVANMVSGSYAVLFWMVFVALGLVAPVALEALNHKNVASNGTTLAIAGEACVLVGAFALRYLVVMAAAPIFA